MHIVQQSKAHAAQVGQQVIVCGVDPGVMAGQRCKTAWSQRVVSVVDLDGDGRLSGGDRLFREWHSHKKGSNFNAQLVANRNKFIVRANGTLKSTAGSVFYCPVIDTRLAKRLVIDRVGRMRVEATGGELQRKCADV